MAGYDINLFNTLLNNNNSGIPIPTGGVWSANFPVGSPTLPPPPPMPYNADMCFSGVAIGEYTYTYTYINEDDQCVYSRNVTVIIDCGEDVCSIISVQLLVTELCDDNDTPADETDDFYIADVVVNYTNAPLTGTLDIHGDASDSINVSSLDSSSQHVFSGVVLPANGEVVDITATFSDVEGCENTHNGNHLQHCSDAVPCAISNVVGSPSCNGDDLEIVVTWSSVSASDTFEVDIDGNGYIVMNSGETYTISGPTVESLGVTITVRDFNDVSCSDTGTVDILECPNTDCDKNSPFLQVMCTSDCFRAVKQGTSDSPVNTDDLFSEINNAGETTYTEGTPICVECEFSSESTNLLAYPISGSGSFSSSITGGGDIYNQTFGFTATLSPAQIAQILSDYSSCSSDSLFFISLRLGLPNPLTGSPSVPSTCQPNDSDVYLGWSKSGVMNFNVTANSISMRIDTSVDYECEPPSDLFSQTCAQTRMDLYDSDLDGASFDYIAVLETYCYSKEVTTDSIKFRRYVTYVDGCDPVERHYEVRPILGSEDNFGCDCHEVYDLTNMISVNIENSGC